MTDFMAENQPAPNGPAPFAPRPVAPRPDGAHLAPTGETGAADAPSPMGPASTDPAPRFAPQRPDTRSDVARPATSRPGPEVKGRIHIADEVVEKVAALAAMEVAGVADLGGDFERAVESVRDRIGLGNKRGDQGVKADVKGHEVTVDVTVMVEYGHVVLDVAREVQSNVATKTQKMLGLKVVEVNVNVDDVRTTRPDEPGQRSAAEA